MSKSDEVYERISKARQVINLAVAEEAALILEAQAKAAQRRRGVIARRRALLNAKKEPRWRWPFFGRANKEPRP